MAEPYSRNNETPWDVYVDERKVLGRFSLGFLVVPNTASFLHKLWRCRHKPADQTGHTHVCREIHWNRPHLETLPTACKWIDCIYQHRGAKFFVHDWTVDETKEFAILRFLNGMCRKKKLSPPFNIVVFLDYDSDHAKARIQNTVRESGKIARCYHLDSRNNDCLQCTDLLLGATCFLGDDPSTIRLQYPLLRQKVDSGEKLRDSEVKRFLAGYLAAKIDVDGTTVYDHRRIEK